MIINIIVINVVMKLLVTHGSVPLAKAGKNLRQLIL